jgi:hypothetical protein
MTETTETKTITLPEKSERVGDGQVDVWATLHAGYIPYEDGYEEGSLARTSFNGRLADGRTLWGTVYAKWNEDPVKLFTQAFHEIRNNYPSLIQLSVYTSIKAE